MKYKITDKEGQCSFEGYSNKDQRTVNCGNPTGVKVGNKYVCVDHLPLAFLGDKKPEMEGLDGKHVKYVPDFLKLAKGQKIHDNQLELDI